MLYNYYVGVKGSIGFLVVECTYVRREPCAWLFVREDSISSL